MGLDDAEARWDYPFQVVHRVPPGPRSAEHAAFSCGASGAGSTAVKDMGAEMVKARLCPRCFPR